MTDNGVKPGASADLIAKAIVTLNRVMSMTSPTPSVVFTADYSIQFVWHKSGWDIELEVAEWFVEGWASERETGHVVSGELDEIESEFIDLIARIGPAA